MLKSQIIGQIALSFLIGVWKAASWEVKLEKAEVGIYASAARLMGGLG